MGTTSSPFSAGASPVRAGSGWGWWSPPRWPPWASSAPCRAAGDRVTDREAEMNGAGRIVLRYSGTESLARIMVEGEEQGRVERIAAELADMIRSAIGR